MRDRGSDNHDGDKTARCWDVYEEGRGREFGLGSRGLVGFSLYNLGLG